MSSTLPNVLITKEDWQEVYTLTSIQSGIPISIQNVGDTDLRFSISATKPDRDHDSYNLITRSQIMRPDDGDTKIWLFSAQTNGLANIKPVHSAGDFLVAVAEGRVPGHRVIHKFGSGNVSTTPIPVTASGLWRTPTATVNLEFVSNNVNDTVNGTGARKITVHGIDADWNETVEVIETNGTTAVPLTLPLLRLHRWYVSESGTYADETSASYAGELSIQELGGGALWDSILGTLPFPAQSEIGVLTIPIGYTGYILSKNIFTDTSKSANIYFIQRPFANDVVAPYTGIRKIIERDIGVTGGYNVNYRVPKGPFVGPCDIGFMAHVSVGSADVSVEYEMLLIEDGY